jgi:hypothetical protein
VSVTAMSLTLKSRATTSERSIGESGIARSMLTATRLPQLSSSTRPRTVRGYSRMLAQPIDTPVRSDRC